MSKEEFNVKSISMKEFAQIQSKYKNRDLKKDLVTEALASMEPGQALSMSHALAPCYQDGYGTGQLKHCGIHSVKNRVQARTGHRYKVKHIGNNTVIIACFAKEES